MEATGTKNATAVDRLRESISVTEAESVAAVMNGFPSVTLERIADRMESGSELERSLYIDVFNVNVFSYLPDGTAQASSVRDLNCIALTSDLVDLVPWFGWDAVRASLTDALEAVPQDQINIDEFDVSRLRSAVLVNIVKDRSYGHESYQLFVDFFASNYEVILKNITVLTESHDDLHEMNLAIVEDIIHGASPSLVTGTL